MTVVVKQGDLQVIQTGSVLIANNSPTKIVIDDNYNINIKYIDDSKDKGQGITAKVDQHGVTIELKNFNNPLGTTTNTPIPIAMQGKQTIYISLTVVAIGEIKILMYGLYMDEAGDKNA